MVLLPLVEIVSRQIGGRGIPGTVPLVQHLTLWVGFLGAALAAREGKLLSFATGQLLPEGKFRSVALVFSSAVAAAIATLLCLASAELVAIERDGGSMVTRFLPTWVAQLVRPPRLLWSNRPASGLAGQPASPRTPARRRGARGRRRARAVRRGAGWTSGVARAARVAGRHPSRCADLCRARRRCGFTVHVGRRSGCRRPGRDLPTERLADTCRDPTVHAGRLPAGPRPGFAPPAEAVSRLVRVDPGGHGRRLCAHLRLLHDPHRRLGRHDPGPRRTVDPRPPR